jgi:peroxiredoxin
VLATALTVLAALAAQPPVQSYGHSEHGVAFDEGPRQRPWRMHGIGRAPFPITSKVPEVQEWFDQGNALLHSFWYYEAERAFRWCIKLDPDCAMGYWGAARACVRDRARYDAMLREAVARKHLASPRERMYIEAWGKASLPELGASVATPELGWNGISPRLAHEIEQIVLAFPDDIEAKAYLALASMFDHRYGNELILREVLAQAPDHPGAHHYRIHNWDTLELCTHALASAARYGQIAPAIGHANHMPGHTYGKLGMWHEAAIWLDAATRTEKAYMAERLLLPFHDWNYGHNRNYLSEAQSQLGMAAAAIAGAKDLLRAPLDKKYNDPDKAGPGTFRQGIATLRRALVRFERWQEIVGGAIPWRKDLIDDQVWQHACEALAHVGLRALDKAEACVLALRQLEAKTSGELAAWHAILWREAQGVLHLARGETADGLRLLSEAAEREIDKRKEDNDPPTYPRVIYDVLGEAYLDLASPGAAKACFLKSLEVLRNGSVPLAGLARAELALGDRAAAEHAYARLLHVCAHADPGLPWLARARALGLTASPRAESPGSQRSYADTTLAELGPERWEPFAAPELSALDDKGLEVTLADLRGKNALLVFYLSDQCTHCVSQLLALASRHADFAQRNTVLLAVSADSPQHNAQSAALAKLPLRLLSDPEHANAKRFQAYDDFEELALHATILLDARARVRWARVGGDPFTDIDFLLAELDRLVKEEPATAAAQGAR